MILQLILFGLLGGFVGGLLGIGGGLIFILILPVLLSSQGVPEGELIQFTIANSLFATFFSGLAAMVVHLKNKNIYPKAVLIISGASIVTTFVILKTVVNTSWYSRDPFNVVVILILLYLIYRTLSKLNPKEKALAVEKTTQEEQKPKTFAFPLIGIITGTISPLSGLGGGSIIVPALNSFLGISIYKANSISLGVISFTSLGATITNLFEEPTYKISSSSSGYIIFDLVVPLVGGVIAGSPLGVMLAKKLSNRVLKLIFTGFLIVVVLKKAYELVI